MEIGELLVLVVYEAFGWKEKIMVRIVSQKDNI